MSEQKFIQPNRTPSYSILPNDLKEKIMSYVQATIDIVNLLLSEKTNFTTCYCEKLLMHYLYLRQHSSDTPNEPPQQQQASLRELKLKHFKNTLAHKVMRTCFNRNLKANLDQFGLYQEIINFLWMENTTYFP
jgi:hypothetical protein